jgi:hypothetical protein
MAKRAPSSQSRNRRSRLPVDDMPALAADAANASTTDNIDTNEAPGEVLAAETGPSEDDIRTRAYHRYLERGGVDGHHFDDWLEAERELKNRT